MKKLFIVLAVSLLFVGLIVGVDNLPVFSAYPEQAGPVQSVPDGVETGTLTLNEVEVVEMPAVDNEFLLQEDKVAVTGTPNRFAIPFDVEISPESNGNWEMLANGDLLWRLRILSPDAKSLNFGFGEYHLPNGAKLTFYTPDYQIIRGPFTAADNDKHGQFWTPILKDKEVVLQLVLPKGVQDDVSLLLTAVNHGYKDIKSPNSPDSGACNVDVICSEGDGWRDQIRSVGVFTLGGTWYCSGALINNTAQDMTPYFLTAYHCDVTVSSAPTVVVYWNFENSTCRVPGSSESGGPGDGSLAQFNSGTIFRSGYSSSDMTLIEMDDPIANDVNPYFSGWDKTSAEASSSVAIHHPRTDEKRISFENDPTTTTSYYGTSIPGDGTHVRVTDWDLGTTEGGSSGSPLYNQDFRIIGQLHGGDAACGNDSSDWYGRLSVSWVGGGTSATRLSDWLDPLNSGATVLDGRSLDVTPDFTLTAQPSSQNVCAGTDAVFTVDIASVNGFSDSVTLGALGQPAATTASFSVNPVTPTGASQLTIGNTGSVASGDYDIEIQGVAPTSTHTTTVNLTVADAAPGMVVLQTPANGAENQPIQPVFTWQPIAGAASYNFWLATDAAFSNIVDSATGLTDATYTTAIELGFGTPYYWRVQAVNNCGEGSYSSSYLFTTKPVYGQCALGVPPSIIYTEDFESGATGWTTSGTNNTWILSTTRVNSGSYAYHAENIDDVSDQYLVSPEIVVPNNHVLPSLMFWNYQAIESDVSACYDGGVLEISTNSGSSWTRMEAELQTDPYHGAVGSDFGNPLGGENAWCGDSQDWLNSIVTLDAYAGQTVQLRWRLGTDSSVGREGWYVDDVMVQTCGEVVVPDDFYLYLPLILKDISE